MVKLEKWYFESETRRIWNRNPANLSSESMNYGHRMIPKHQKCITIHHKPFWMAVTNWIFISLLFSDFQFRVVGMDLLRKHKGIIPLRPFLQLDHARKSSSGGQNISKIFLRLRIIYLLLNALRPACSQYYGVKLHQAFYSKVHSYELFFGNAFI